MKRRRWLAIVALERLGQGLYVRVRLATMGHSWQTCGRWRWADASDERPNAANFKGIRIAGYGELRAR